MQRLLCVLVCSYVLTPSFASGAIVINEFVYDDGVVDDREFVELFNNGNAPVSIGGWTLARHDQLGPKGTVTITAGAVINPGAYYVIGQPDVLNVNQVVTTAGGFLEQDSERLELRNAGALIDAVIYESNRGPAAPLPLFGQGYGTPPADVLAKVGPGIWGNNQSFDLPGTPKLSTAGLARWVDGRDTNNNGRDFGFRPNTPGASNNPTPITEYIPPDVSSVAVGTILSGFAYVLLPRVIDPTVADSNNPNAIGEPPRAANRAILAWETADGGNAVSSAGTFTTPQAKFDLFAYFDTRDLPQMMKGATPFRGSEMSVYGIGSTDALANQADLSGQVGIADTANGTTGIAWVYEKVAAPNPANPPGPGNMVSEKLYLVDAKDGGDAGLGGARPINWTILTEIDLSATDSGWFRLGIDIDALGNGVARFGDQMFNFVTAQHGGAFSVAYRENAQIGSTTVPRDYLRPPTFIAVPEPAAWLQAISLIGCWMSFCRRRTPLGL